MKSTESRMLALETTVNAIAEAMGIEADTPKTTARVGSSGSNRPSKAVKSKLSLKRKAGKTTAPARKSQSDEDGEILIENVGGNRSDGRMRLPARMFGTRDHITVEGHKFTKLVSDGNRSANFNPAILGADVGDDILFIHESGSKWTCEVTSHPGRRRGKTTVKKPVTTSKAKKAAKPSPARGTRVGTDKLALAKEAAKKFGKLARENAADDFVNENIVEATKFEDDPRQYLTSRENAQAKRVWKRQAGITLSQWVELLSKEVYS